MNDTQDTELNLKSIGAQFQKLAETNKLAVDDIVSIFNEAVSYVIQRKHGSGIQVKVFLTEDQHGIYRIYTVVDSVVNPVLEISLIEARKTNSAIQLGEQFLASIDQNEWNRTDVNSIKWYFSKFINNMIRKKIIDKYQKLQHKVVHGIVESVYEKSYQINLNGTNGMLYRWHAIPREELTKDHKYAFFIENIDVEAERPTVNLSRNNPEMIREMLSQNVPEINDQTVEIKLVVREPGMKTKIGVISHDVNVDPIRACLGVDRSRIASISSEFGNEKIELFRWSENQLELIKNVLAPIKIILVQTQNNYTANKEKIKKMTVVVPDDKIALAVGSKGINIRLYRHILGDTNLQMEIVSETEAKDKKIIGEFNEQAMNANNQQLNVFDVQQNKVYSENEYLQLQKQPKEPIPSPEDELATIDIAAQDEQLLAREEQKVNSLKTVTKPISQAVEADVRDSEKIAAEPVNVVVTEEIKIEITPKTIKSKKSLPTNLESIVSSEIMKNLSSISAVVEKDKQETINDLNDDQIDLNADDELEAYYDKK